MFDAEVEKGQHLDPESFSDDSQEAFEVLSRKRFFYAFSFDVSNGRFHVRTNCRILGYLHGYKKRL